MSLLVVPLTPAPSVCEFLASASEDPTITHNAYLPAHMTEAAALDWISRQPKTSWLIVLDDSFVGLAQLSPAEQCPPLTLPPGSFETETWLVDCARGRGVASEAWSHIREQLRSRHPEVRHLVGVVWENNESSHRRLAKDGFGCVGEVWWEGDGGAGWCRVWTLSLEGLVR